MSKENRYKVKLLNILNYSSDLKEILSSNRGIEKELRPLKTMTKTTYIVLQRLRS